MTNRNSIINAFCALNIRVLHKLLDNDRTYQDASKELFLLKVWKLFEIYKKAGDTRLMPFPGKCCSGACSNLGREGFSFVGDVSKYYFNIIIEMTADEVTDIYHCSDFLADEDVDVSSELKIDICEDENVDFKPSVNYLITAKKCSAAIEEIKNSNSGLISKVAYQLWLQKHEELFKSFGLPPIRYRKHYDFFSLYTSITCFFNWIPYEEELEKATVSFNTIDKTNEKTVLLWLVEYEQLWGQVLGRPYNFELDTIPNFITVDNNYNLTVAASECAPIDNFLQRFQLNYWPLLEKYSTTYDKDFVGKKMSSEEFRKNHSLTFHLKLQGLI